MARGRGGKAKRGGGHSYSRDLVLNEDGVAVSNERRGCYETNQLMIDTLHSPSRNGRVRSARKWREEDANRPDNDSQKSESTEEESEDDEELEEPAAEPSSSAPVDPSTARAAKKAQKQQAKARATGAKAANEEDGDEEDEEDLINPNHATPKKFKASDLDSASPEPSRREREAKEKKEAQERYWKLHAAGKTEQAKNDLARLAAIRKQREEAAAKRKAEQEAKEAEIEAKKTASRQKQ